VTRSRERRARRATISRVKRTLFLLSFFSASAHAQGTDEPQILAAIPSEATPEPEEHYLSSNEWRHDLFFDAVRDLGGAFVGVGADQCYTLAAAQDAQIAFLVDYDAEVPRLHRVYGALVTSSASPAELVARFEPEGEAGSVAILERALAGDPERGEIVRVYRRNRSRLRPYLHHVSRLERDGRPASWLADPALYARVRSLFTRGRIVARTGDVTGPLTLRAVGEAAARLSVPVRVLYLSNAEQFFRYTPSFSDNVRALPSDERALVLRTFRHPRNTPYPEGDDWHYMVHPMPDFMERLALGYRRNTHIVMDAVRAGLDRRGVTTIGPRTPRDYGRARP
jgi:hypothetical protein